MTVCLNEIYNEVCIGKCLSDTFPIQNGLKQVDAFIIIVFQLYCIVCHEEGPCKPRGTEIEWDASVSCELMVIVQRCKYYKEKHIALLVASEEVEKTV